MKALLSKLVKGKESQESYLKDIKEDLSGLNQKVDSHVTSIRQLEQQFGQMSATVNQRQPDTLPSNIMVNPRSDSHCHSITTQSGKVNTDLPLPMIFEHKNDKEPVDVENSSKQDGGENKVADPVLKPIQPLSSYLQRLRKKRRCAIATRSLVEKMEDPGAFTLPYTIRSFTFAHALCDLAAIIKLMPFVVFKQLGLGAPKPTTMRRVFGERMVKKLVGILYDILVKVVSFIFPTNFVILDCEVDLQIPIILGRPFLYTGRTLIDMELGQLILRLNNEQVMFSVCKSMR
ncbi:uncharacterized protein LOC124887770 [Capsicum annuum]|uniref:uncharacterized protein LOC124887770 n=1 Tax=Capsicum annuum TaxID=4072 RepID=UPI001FB14774|nr:uncharacterized protein LOC124887770 [Capsicum annuum]